MQGIKVKKVFGYKYMVVDAGMKTEIKYGSWKEKFAWVPKVIVPSGTNHYGGEYGGEIVWLKKYYEREVIMIVYLGGSTGELWGNYSSHMRIERKKHLFDFLKNGH